MTIVEPIPGNYGKADWVDYSNYWREADAEWIQARSILRYASNATRDSNLPAPGVGQVVYNDALDMLQLRSNSGAWKSYAPLPANLAVTTDTTVAVTLAHALAAGKGVVFGPNDVQINHNLKVLTNILQVDATGVLIKLGTKTAKLTTDAANLISDSPISAPGFIVTAPGTVNASGRAATVGSLTVEGALTSASVSASGAVNGGSGTIGGVAHSGNKATASAGFDSQSGSFYGDGTSAIVRHVNRTGPYLQATTGGVYVAGGGFFDVSSQMRVFGGQAIHYIRADGVHTGYIAPSFWGGDPGVGNVPEGTIWIS